MKELQVELQSNNETIVVTVLTPESPIWKCYTKDECNLEFEHTHCTLKEAEEFNPICENCKKELYYDDFRLKLGDIRRGLNKGIHKRVCLVCC